MNSEKTDKVSEAALVEEKLQRVNLILRTIRKVDQVILAERYRERLIERVCKNLVKMSDTLCFNHSFMIMNILVKIGLFAREQ